MSPRETRTLSREEFVETIADLKSDLREDLRGITEHLADLNGRTRKGEVADAEMRGQIALLQVQLEAHDPRAAAARPPVAEASGSVHVLSPKAQAALVGSSVVLLTVIFKAVGLIAGALGQKAIDLVLKK